MTFVTFQVIARLSPSPELPDTLSWHNDVTRYERHRSWTRLNNRSDRLEIPARGLSALLEVAQ